MIYYAEVVPYEIFVRNDQNLADLGSHLVDTVGG